MTNTERAARRAERKAENLAHAARMAEIHAESLAIVATGKCPTCGKDFEKSRPWQDFCSQECQMRYWHFTHPRPKRAVMPTERQKSGKIPLNQLRQK